MTSKKMIIKNFHDPIEKKLVKIIFIEKIIFVGSVPNKTARKSE